MYNTISVMNMKRYRYNKEKYSSVRIINANNLVKNIQQAQPEQQALAEQQAQALAEQQAQALAEQQAQALAEQQAQALAEQQAQALAEQQAQALAEQQALAAKEADYLKARERKKKRRDNLARIMDQQEREYEELCKQIQ